MIVALPQGDPDTPLISSLNANPQVTLGEMLFILKWISSFGGLCQYEHPKHALSPCTSIYYFSQILTSASLLETKIAHLSSDIGGHIRLACVGIVRSSCSSGIDRWNCNLGEKLCCLQNHVCACVPGFWRVQCPFD